MGGEQGHSVKSVTWTAPVPPVKVRRTPSIPPLAVLGAERGPFGTTATRRIFYPPPCSQKIAKLRPRKKQFPIVLENTVFSISGRQGGIFRGRQEDDF